MLEIGKVYHAVILREKNGFAEEKVDEVKGFFAVPELRQCR